MGLSVCNSLMDSDYFSAQLSCGKKRDARKNRPNYEDRDNHHDDTHLPLAEPDAFATLSGASMGGQESRCPDVLGMGLHRDFHHCRNHIFKYGIPFGAQF